MRRAFRPPSPDPDTPPPPAGPSWPKHELVDVSGLSDKTFDTIRKAARIRGPSHGGRNHLFSADDLIALIIRAESGRFSERGPPAAAAWRQLLREAGIRPPEPRR